ncbi:MAG: hypothetical protein IKC26_11410 [Clostridia bacterium]|nr:hypothetical protein [Clostridia bacterium]MBR2908634.1 hypothetical protein [Clostridia bacterium]
MKKASHKHTERQAPSASPIAPEKLQLLVTVVNREKAEFYTDLLLSFEVNLQLTLSASGTASTEMLNLLGLSENEKSVLLSVIREDRAKAALSTLDKKFRTIRGGKGIAYTIPMTGTIGVAIYRFLANIPDEIRTKKEGSL